MDWVPLAQDNCCWRTFMNTVMNRRVRDNFFFIRLLLFFCNL
jgi:hypothetical protein